MVIESPLTSNILKHQIIPIITKNKEKKNKIDKIVKSQEIKNKIVQQLMIHVSENYNVRFVEII